MDAEARPNVSAAVGPGDPSNVIRSKMIQRAYEVNVVFDSVKGRYVVLDSTIDGLHVEASSAAEMVAMISDQAKAILCVPSLEICINNLPAAGQKAASA